jgi:hypothetical protein
MMGSKIASKDKIIALLDIFYIVNLALAKIEISR